MSRNRFWDRSWACAGQLLSIFSRIPRSLWESFSFPVSKVVNSTPVTNLELRCEAKQTKRTINN